MEAKQLVKNLQDKYHYLSSERFASILKMNAFTESEIREYSKLIGKGVANFIIEAPQSVIDAVLNYDIDLQFKSIRFSDKNFEKYFVKIIYKIKDQDKFYSEEINLLQYDGNKILTSLHENSNVEIIATCRMSDEINQNDKHIKIYEGDIISASDWGYRSANNLIIMAFIDDTYIGGDSYYRELLWTDKYGYLAPNKKTKPNLDNQPIAVSSSSFNYKEGRYNYHKITLCESYQVLGNIHTHYNYLLPEKFKTVE